MRCISTLVLLSLGVTATPFGRAAEGIWPMPEWTRARPADVGMDAKLLEKARDYALSGDGSGYITRHGKLVMSWGGPTRRYDLKSTTKSFGATALGLAVADGKVKLSDKASKYHPSLGVPPEENRKTGWLDEITIQHLATQTAGFEKPGGYTRLIFRPGTQWHYSDGGPNWLAECLTLVYRRDLKDLMFQRVFTPLGIGAEDLTWRKNSYRDANIEGIPRREFGSGISANVDAMARVGYLYLRQGRWQGEQILPEEFVAAASTAVPEVAGLPEHDGERFDSASAHYGLLWWNNADGALSHVPRDAFWSWGLYDSLIVVIPSLDVVVARAGKSWQRADGADHYAVLAPFLEPIVASVADAERPQSATPYPPSSVIAGFQWAPPSTVVRRARGSDNWPITWGDDDALYTAYGDGWGFEPRVPEKLSLGLAKVTGGPTDFRGENLRSPTAEQRGDGPSGKKASGMLMIGGVLYMAVRNADASQLAWSTDRGKTWTWSPWRFQQTFGCPTFLNYGRNYQGARDENVYVVSPEGSSAYRPTDRMLLARVHKDRIQDRKAYEFFSKVGSDGRPVWTGDITRRGAVFRNAGRCGRSTVAFHEALGRYLWVQVLPGEDARSRTGLAVFDAPEPWGPWTTVYYAEHWDIDPGETAGFVHKWTRRDGRELYLVFSGEDSFSVRRATAILVGHG